MFTARRPCFRPGAAAVATPSRLPTIAVGTAAAATTVAPLMRKSRRDAPSSLGEWLGMVWFSSKRSEEHTSELQSQSNLVCRLLLEKKKKTTKQRRLTNDHRRRRRR